MPEPSQFPDNNSDSNTIKSNINANNNEERLINNETEDFVLKTLDKCNKYRNNTNTEINKLKKVNEELSTFLNTNNQDMSKIIQAYKDEMNSELNSDPIDNIDASKINLPSPPNGNS